MLSPALQSPRAAHISHTTRSCKPGHRPAKHSLLTASGLAVLLFCRVQHCRSAAGGLEGPTLAPLLITGLQHATNKTPHSTRSSVVAFQHNPVRRLASHTLSGVVVQHTTPTSTTSRRPDTNATHASPHSGHTGDAHKGTRSEGHKQGATRAPANQGTHCSLHHVQPVAAQPPQTVGPHSIWGVPLCHVGTPAVPEPCAKRVGTQDGDQRGEKGSANSSPDTQASSDGLPACHHPRAAGG